ncbi:glycosyltransferase family 4 protein [Amphritea balenae]|uniref:Glycosyltransferase n=1 Tax=Amphritea balenae TaxID=452629 RepID=A0A3P1SUG4_9GAMM|nr:glycosyltransferase family 4 protein [Amphritea balenae]RRD00196.1 glycosyltransferase [Amphritea balenae]GGK77485.1 hypothetical protein GCM10007941_29510 [Amphritea balenae]
MRVIILQRVLPHYRVPFFDLLYKLLKDEGVELFVIYGQECPGSVPASCEYTRDWSLKIDNKYFSFFGKEIVYQPVFHLLSTSDLVIVEQANRLVLNYLLLVLRRLTKLKVAFWGHGKNFQSYNSDDFFEKIKRFYSSEVDWWFSYTNSGVSIIKSLGFPESKITCVDNSIDVSELKLSSRNVELNDVLEIKKTLGIISNNVAVYCGGMYSEKKINFLLESCDLVRKEISDFEVLFIGDGPDSKDVINYTVNRSWAHFIGPKVGVDRVPYFKISKILLMPGLVGLAVLDSFAFEVPMITTNIPIHSPEFDYLDNNVNGIVTEFDVHLYSKKVIELFKDDSLLIALKEGCRSSASNYSVENMASNFHFGVLKAVSGVFQ